jgi:hypothetical protein
VLLFYYNEGRLRAFAVMALLLGFMLYRGSLGRLFCRFSLPVAHRIAKGITCLCAWLIRPLLWFFRLIVKPIRLVQRKMVEQRLRRYHAARAEALGKLSKKGFVNI